MKLTVDEIAAWIGATVEGDGSLEISGLAKIEEAHKGHLTFIANPKYTKYIDQTDASAVLVDMDFPQSSKTLLRTDNPYFSFLQIAQRIYLTTPNIPKGVHKTAIIGKNAQLGDEVAIGAYVVIGDDCRIGDGTTICPGTMIGDRVIIGSNCLLYSNVSIREECRVGNRCILHMGAVIGSDGFGYAFEQGKYHKLPQMGIVVLEDEVEIGANTTIDRATMGETKISRGTKLDNLIQIAHNVEIDENTACAAQTGISGSTKIGKYVMIGGQAGLVGHITVGDQAKIGAQAGVTKSVPEDTFVSGYPARPFRREMREIASLAKLPDLLKRVKQLEKKVAELQDQLKSD